MNCTKKITEFYNSEVFFDRVKELVKTRKKQNISNFLHDTGINLYSYYSLQKQNNFPRADVAQQIANALDVSLDFLVTGKDRKSGISSEEIIEKAFPYPDEYKLICEGLLGLEEDQRDMLIHMIKAQIKYFQDKNAKK